MSNTGFREALKYITSTTDLDELNILIREALGRRSAIGSINVRALKRGDEVKFKNRDGGYTYGYFFRRLRKNVEIQVGQGRWRVSAAIVERV